MENICEKLRALKCRSWADAKNILCKIFPEPSQEKFVKTYHVNAETLPEEDRKIYGTYLKNEPFYLERCKTCLQLLKPVVMEYHNDLHHKKNEHSSRKSIFISPNKKKLSKRSNRSTSEDDSESIISSEMSSPTIDSTENNDSIMSAQREDYLGDIISVEEIASGESKPPTPGPRDLYEEFSVPCIEETSNSLSSIGDLSNNAKSSVFNSKSLKLKIISNKDTNQKVQTTSLLEAHLLSDTKYCTSSDIPTIDLQLNNLANRFSSSSKIDTRNMLEQSLTKEETAIQTESWKSSNSPSVLKTDTKISIPISVFPQNVKIVGSKKQIAVSKTMLFKSANLKLSLATDVDKEKIDCSQPSSPFGSVDNENVLLKLSSSDYVKDKSPSRSKKSKCSKNKNRAAKNINFDPNKHCGVLVDENKNCLRSLTCKTHAISLRRNVPGRSKEFDKLLAEHRASKETLKEQDRNRSANLSDPIISIPKLEVDKLSGNTIQIPSTNSEPEIIKIRLPSNVTSLENAHSDNETPIKSENDKVTKKLSFGKLSAAPNTNTKPLNTVHRVQLNTTVLNGDVKPQLYGNDIKVSFVCSNMLYKIGGLLYTDRSQQAIRKCMLPLTTKSRHHKVSVTKQQQSPQTTPSRKISDFLQIAKSKICPPIKLNLFKENVEAVKREPNVKCDSQFKLKTSEEIERMKNVLVSTGKILRTLSTDENELRKLRLTRTKRSADKTRNCVKRIKQECIADENYDINTLLYFDKPLLIKSEPDDGLHSVRDNVVYSYNTNGHQMYADNSQLVMDRPTIPAVQDNIESSSLPTEFIVNNSNQLWKNLRVLQTQIDGGVNSEQHYAAQSESDIFVTSNLLPTSAPAVFKGSETDGIDGISNIEEAISKNYSLLEEYCKNVTTDELLLAGKGDFNFYESNLARVNGGATTKLNKGNELQMANPATVDNINSAGVTVNAARVVGSSSGLNFDATALTTYLSGSAAVGTITANENNYVTDQFDVVRTEALMVEQIMSRENVYENIMTLNKQLAESTAVKIEKPPTPAPNVYSETENEEVLKWLC